MSTLLINANQPEEVRVALLAEKQPAGDLPSDSEATTDMPPAYREAIKLASANKANGTRNNKVSNLYIENTLKKTTLKNIYAGIIRSIEPSLEAAFIEFGSERHGFLPFKEIAPEYCKERNPQNVKNALKVGQSIIVQVKKEERGTKGAALTTYITLPGSYLVLMPNNPSSGGISKRIAGEDRKTMQQVAGQLEIPENMGVILRTAGVGRPMDALQRDLKLLIKQWEAIQAAFKSRKAPFLIFQESDILVRAIRDYLREDIEEIIVDSPVVFEKLKAYMTNIRPDLLQKLRLYKSRTPLFLQFGIEEEVESAFQSSLRLPSGGTIIFDRAEALVAIDINSGGSTKHEDIAETAFKTNLEAAEVIARQLRLRDLGGLIVIDFIDMEEETHKRQVEAKLRECTQEDRARIQIGSISSFGLLEMSRQRLRSSLGKANEDVCPACQGQGIRRSVESLALSAIRAVEKSLFSKKVKQIRLETSLELATYLGNEKRGIISQLEKDYQFTLLLLPNPYWEASQYKIVTFNQEELASSTKEQPASYALLSDQIHEATAISSLAPAEVPAVQNVEQRLPTQHQPKLGFVKSVLNKLVTWGQSASPFAVKETKSVEQSRPPAKKERSNAQGGNALSKTAGGRRPLPRRNETLSNPTASQTVHNKRKKPSVVSNKVTKPIPSAKLKGEENVSNMRSNLEIPSDKADTKLVSMPKNAANEPKMAEQSNNKRVVEAAKAPVKNGIVHRYGGEPRMQQRSYPTRQIKLED
jgi:ribonuclease E